MHGRSTRWALALALTLVGAPVFSGCATSATRGMPLDAEAPEMGYVGAPRQTARLEMPAWREPVYESFPGGSEPLPVFMPGSVRSGSSLRGEVVPTGAAPRQGAPRYPTYPLYPSVTGGSPSAPC
jgi:hypothetical protein